MEDRPFTAVAVNPADTQDALLGLRGRITARTGGIAAALIVPFCLFHLSAGRVGLALVDLLAALVLGGNAWWLVKRQRALLPYPVLASAVVAGVLASVHYVGAPALYWAFPSTLFFYMVLPRRVAHYFCGGLMVVCAGLAGVQFGTSNAMRFGATAGLMLLLLNVVLGVIGELQHRLVLQSVTDPLTGAYNRRDLHAVLQRLTAPAEAPRRAVLLSFDIDHFKSINDQLGHAAGDQVLREVVALVNTRVRDTDRLFRVGGEEFVLVLHGITLDAARRVAEELRLRIESAPLLPARTVTVSIGISPLTEGADPDGWLRSVDSAMYEAKRLGRNRVVAA
jgi:diguanylate cyclase (GGDEF)-like protein